MQPWAVGVTVTIETTGVVVALRATKDAIFPVPLLANPILVLPFAQEYAEPGTGPVKITGVELVFVHNTWLIIVKTLGTGSTLTEAVSDKVPHEFVTL